MKTLRIAARVATAILCAGLSLAAVAQGTPPQTMKIVVPYSPGGATDLLARLVAERLRERSGRTVIVENRPGASGQIGAKFVAEAAPDGSTFLVHTPAWVTSNIFFKSPSVSAPDGLEPVSLLAEEEYVLASSVGAPFETFRQFASYAKANPGKLNFASGGLGETYLIFEAFKKEQALDIVSVEYKGAAPALIALMTNEVQLGYQPATIADSQTRDGKMRMLAISGDARSPRYPNVPTFKESGVNHARHRWYALYAPPKTPKAIVDRVNADIAAILATPEVAAKLAAVSMVPRSSKPGELRKLTEDSMREYTQMSKFIGYQPQN